MRLWRGTADATRNLEPANITPPRLLDQKINSYALSEAYFRHHFFVDHVGLDPVHLPHCNGIYAGLGADAAAHRSVGRQGVARTGTGS